jgi:hypothetical protein
VVREDGKVLKPPGFVPPDLADEYCHRCGASALGGRTDSGAILWRRRVNRGAWRALVGVLDEALPDKQRRRAA